MGFFGLLFDTSGFPARWHCGVWSPFLGWLHILSDFAIAAAYFAIPLLMVAFIRRRQDFPFSTLFWLFIAFIASCGTCHLIEAIIFWSPIYRASGVAKFVTAMASWGTALALIPALPRAMSYRSPEVLEAEVQARTQELEKEKAKLEGILRSLSVGVVVSSEASVQQVNQAAMSILDIAPDQEAIETRLEALDITDAQGVALNARDTFAGPLSEPVDRKEVHLRRSDSPRAATVLSLSRQKFSVEAQSEGVVSVFEDITEEAARKRELLGLNLELSRSNEELEQFAYVASHDLQEPLRMVSSFSELLQRKYRSVLGSEGQRYIDFLTDGAFRMQELIDELLRYSRVQPPNASTRSREALTPLVRRAMKRLQTSLDESSAEIVVGPLPTLEVAPGHIVQIFQNLLSNALKFRREVTPRVEISSRRQDGEWVISVADNGIGIDERFFSRIFLVFQRLHTRDEFEGTGVGLAIVKRIVEQHGGRVWVESQLGEGTSFHFTLPGAVSPDPDTPGAGGSFDP